MQNTTEQVDEKTFITAISNAEFGGPLRQQLIRHFCAEMDAAMQGRICTLERMAILYPVFREINAEMAKINSETGGLINDRTK